MTTHYERGTTFSGPLCLVVPIREIYLEEIHLAAGYPRGAQVRRARNAAVLTRFWQEVEQYRRVPLREVST